MTHSFLLVKSALILANLLLKSLAPLPLGSFSVFSLTILLSTLTIIAIYYLVRIGHLPNFFSYFEYAIGYASGYGYVPFPLNGPGNLIFLIFLQKSFYLNNKTNKIIKP
jgi:hypothetical protein